jgi:hypothetical protein
MGIGAAALINVIALSNVRSLAVRCGERLTDAAG